MMKKIWACISVITALITGAYVYQCVKLLIWYQDRRLGIFILLCAAAVGILFLYSIWQIYRKRNRLASEIGDVWKVHRKGLACSNGSFCAAMSGITLYRGKEQDILYTGMCIGIILLFTVTITLLMLFAGNKGNLREKAFQEKMKELAPVLEGRGLLKYDTVSEEIADEVIGARVDGIKGNNAVGIMGAGLIMNIFFLNDGGWKSEAFIVAAIILPMFVMTAADIIAGRKLNTLLNDGYSESVLAFFIRYYGYAKGRRESLLDLVQLNAVVALCDLNAYEEALSLLKAISRKPQMEAYYLQFEVICHEGMRNRKELASALGRMEMALQFLKGKNREKIQDVYHICNNLCYRRYEEALKLIEKEEGLSKRQKRLRMKLREDACNKVFGAEK